MISMLLDIGWIIFHFLEFYGLSDMFDGHLGSGFGAVPTVYPIYYSKVFWLQGFIYRFWMLFNTFSCQQDFLAVFYVSICESFIVFGLLRDGILTLQRTYDSFALFSWHIRLLGIFRIWDVLDLHLIHFSLAFALIGLGSLQ